MKRFLTAALASLSLAALLSGCGKPSTQSAVDTSALEKSFTGADAAIKDVADKAVAEVKTGNYSAAVADLKALPNKMKLTPAQTEAIQDVIAQIEQAGPQAGKIAASAATNTAEELQKSLPK
jgi:hypothetical protein